MDLRGSQDKRFGMPNSLGSYNPPIRETSSTSIIPPPTTTPLGERSRREGNGNGITMFTSSQTLDHHNHHHHHHHHHHHDHEERDPDPEPDPDPDPDPIPVSIAVTGSSSSTSVVRYQECLKNHAASAGGHVIDGCCEFMPDGEDGTPESLKCAACDCHRNFHRKEINGENQSGANRLYYYRSNKIPPPHLPLPPPPPPHPSTSIPPPMMMAFGRGVGAAGPTDSSSDELNVYHSNVGATVAMAPPQPQTFASSKKRFRTKFTQEQKDKMLDLAEKIGWRIQKQDESTVQQFCEEVGVKRQVLKVWMHNNKHSSMKKKD